MYVHKELAPAQCNYNNRLTYLYICSMQLIDKFWLTIIIISRGADPSYSYAHRSYIINEGASNSRIIIGSIIDICTMTHCNQCRCLWVLLMWGLYLSCLEKVYIYYYQFKAVIIIIDIAWCNDSDTIINGVVCLYVWGLYLLIKACMQTLIIGCRCNDSL